MTWKLTHEKRTLYSMGVRKFWVKQICESAVRAFLRNTLKIDGAVVDGIQFTLCHCLRAQRYTMVRPIIVRFRDYSDSECVWKNMRVIPKHSNFSLSKDFPKSIVYNRKKLLPVFTKARRILGKRDVSTLQG